MVRSVSPHPLVPVLSLKRLHRRAAVGGILRDRLVVAVDEIAAGEVAVHAVEPEDSSQFSGALGPMSPSRSARAAMPCLKASGNEASVGSLN